MPTNQTEEANMDKLIRICLMQKLDHHPAVNHRCFSFEKSYSMILLQASIFHHIYDSLSSIDHFFCTSPSSGIVSLISLAVLSYERYCTMISPTIASGREYRPALGGICFSWLYSVAWTVPPLLGWSRYGPEGPGTTCSVDWRTQTPNNISYIVCLFTFCLVLPFCVILYSYSMLLHTIRQVRF